MMYLIIIFIEIEFYISNNENTVIHFKSSLSKNAMTKCSHIFISSACLCHIFLSETLLKIQEEKHSQNKQQKTVNAYKRCLYCE